jgi:glycosyltransferase involved in cell wall biosynthesis
MTPLDGSAEVVVRGRIERPLISVVLPTYNRAHCLSTSVDSVLGQTERNLELIVVDDGSKDATPELLRRYAETDPRITVIRQQNLRLPRALNNGFRVARGELWTWTSDDNRYLPEALAQMSRCLGERPQVGMVFAEMLRRTAEGLFHWPTPQPMDFWQANKFGGAFLYRRDVARSVGEYDPEMVLVEDYDFFLRFSYAAQMLHLPQVVYEYGSPADSLTSRLRPEIAGALERLLRKHLRLGKAKPWQYSRMAGTIARDYRGLGRYRDGLRMAALAARLWPLNLSSYRKAGMILLFWMLHATGLRRTEACPSGA